MELWAGTKIEAVIQTRSVKEVFLDISQHLQEKYLCQSLFFNKVAGNFIKKETLAQVFSCKFCEKNTFLYRTPLVAAFAKRKADNLLNLTLWKKIILFPHKLHKFKNTKTHKFTCSVEKNFSTELMNLEKIMDKWIWRSNCKRESESKVFPSKNQAMIVGEICGISSLEVFGIRKNYVINGWEEKPGPKTIKLGQLS